MHVSSSGGPGWHVHAHACAPPTTAPDSPPLPSHDPQLTIEAALPRETNKTTPAISIRVSPSSPGAVLQEWGIYNNELWSIDISHDKVARRAEGDTEDRASAGGLGNGAV